MRLKRVKLYGFKTFADKTEFDVDGDIIAVVGPNGCGKSNIVDGILWGLGETNARNLRAQTSKEVIFSGSGARKGLGYAEVNLLFDNESGILPLDCPEVSVSRRLTKAGDSTYQINKRNCRLRDVNDLLADSGLGRAGYAIVTQSEIDSALAASAQQRRAWIDEAAGVQRYRARRTEAIRRMESARDHLSRVQDIITEIETQREPLAEEAENAKRYKTALNSLREVECGLLSQELAQAVQEIAELELQIEQTMKLAQEEGERADELEFKAHELSEAALELETKIDEFREKLTASQANWEQASAALKVTEHKLQSLDDLEKDLSDEAGRSGDRLDSAEAEFAKAKTDIEAEESARESLRQSLSGVSEEAKKLTEALNSAEAELKKAREIVSEQHKFELEAAHAEKRLQQIAKEKTGIEATIPDLKEAVEAAQTQSDQAEEKVAKARALVQEAEAHLAEIRKSEDTHGQRVRQILAMIAATDGKRQGLEATIQAHEGLAQGARAVMAAVSQGTLPDQYRPVGECIEVDSDLALAIDTALGGAANDLIVPNDQAAKEAIRLLKEHRLGRATFQPITLMRPVDKTTDLRQVLVEKGVVGLASDLVQCENDVRPVIDSLLGRTIIVEELDTALKLAKTRGWRNLVTLDGEVVFSSGAVSGGESMKRAAGMVQRKAELAELEEELTELQSNLEQVQKQNDNREEIVAQIQDQRNRAQSQLNDLSHEWDEAKAWLSSLRHELSSTENSYQRLVKEEESLNPGVAIAKAEFNIDELESKRDDLMKQLAAKSSDANSASERMMESDDRVRQARERFQDAERRLASMKESEEVRQRRFENMGPERERLTEQLQEFKLALESAHTLVGTARADVMETMEKRRQALQQSQELREQASKASKSAAATSDILHRSELKRARADSRRTTAIERLLEEYGVNEEEALAMAPQAEIPEDAANLVSKLRRELKAMGDVNLGAIEAYERLTERYDELHNQKVDIEEGMEEIEKSIKELDRLTRERFVDTFEKLVVAFGETFQQLFGGGEGLIMLTESENILDSGVEIAVTIPGKKRQRLELLSGGERAMSALAFLFALLKVKPTPLVILDEVDAPLDGRNVERFISMMRQFSNKTQFILITHNPTTIESADVWFGVTMQEPGVSTLVPFKVPPKATAQVQSEATQAVVKIGDGVASLKG